MVFKSFFRPLNRLHCMNSNLVYEVTLKCSPTDAFTVEQLLWTVEGVMCVTWNDPEELFDLSVDHPIAILKIMLNDPSVEDRIAQTLRAEEASFGSSYQLSSLSTITEEDWAESWKQFWHVTAMTPRLTICPSWEPYIPKQSDEIVITLDPGSAFGTGTHDTTQLMLKAMEKFSTTHAFSTLSVLDVGTGSGILSVYAALLGCPAITAIDIDPKVISVVQANATQNKVAHAITISATPIHALDETGYDLILANIVAPVLLDLLPDMAKRLKPHGRLMMSGIIQSALPALKQVLQQHGFVDITETQQGDWFALEATHSRPAA